MRWQAVAYRKVFLLLAVIAVLGGWSVPRADAQNQQLAGVAIDAKGVVTRQFFNDPTGQGNRQRAAAALAGLSHDVAKFSRLRKVSLTRLEHAIRAAGGAPSDEMRYLAGLLRVRYVFLYPDSRDIVVAGPAEGWMDDITGRIVGLTTHRPVVQLQDLVVALRAFPPGKDGVGMIGCSIDPTKEGLARMQAFLRSTDSNFMAGQEQSVAEYVMQNLPQALGMQVVSVMGVNPKTHFAQVLVEADYRMKLIGIGLERPPVKLIAFVDKVNPAQVSRSALFRWYFVPDYKCVRVSPDKQAMELVGDGVKLVGEDELVSAGGQRKQVSSRSNMASAAFATSFTEKYSALAEKSPVYAELRNLVDLAVAAAFIQEQGYYGKAGWDLGLFANEQGLAIETYNAPQQVEATVAAIMKGHRLMTPIGGGVHIEARSALRPENLLQDDKGKVDEARNAVTLPAGRWWWD
jgi:hypothetical protein